MDIFILTHWMLFISAAVVQLKTVASILSADESLSNFTVEKTGILQKVLVYVVSIICSFIDLHTNTLEKTQLYSNAVEFSVPRNGASSSDPPSSLKVSICETRLQWHQKAVVSVMEAGGLNWLVGKVGDFSFYFILFFISFFQKPRNMY